MWQDIHRDIEKILTSLAMVYNSRMSQEIEIEGVSYVSSKRAAQISGYAQDYIGQLCRGGLIEAQRIGGLWYLRLESLYQYKQKADSYIPTAPRRDGASGSESLVSFDGKDYISAPRASEITGYHQDYVGQLAREGKVLSRQVGNRWYVERPGILAHKKEKDALLASVQVEAVGLSRAPRGSGGNPETLANARYDGETPYFTYTNDERNLLPLSNKKYSSAEESFSHHSGIVDLDLEEKKIPIRVLETKIKSGNTTLRGVGPKGLVFKEKSQFSFRNPLLSWVSATLATIVIVLTIGYASVMNSARYAEIWPTTNESALALASSASQAFSRIGEILERWITSEKVYQRRSD